MAEGIIVGGNTFPVSNPVTGYPIPIFAWNDPPGRIKVLEFKAGDGYNKKRTKQIDLCVWHWTGGEAEPDRMAKVLMKRKLGIEFAIGRYGNIFQFCDPKEVDTADAGIVNSRSVGVEIVCYGFRSWKAIQRGLVPRVGRDRETYLAETHGRKVKTAKFYEAQVTSALALADALSKSLGIPKKVPENEKETVVASVLDGSFKGHCGHYEVSKRKRDPGPWFMETLETYFESGEVSV